MRRKAEFKKAEAQVNLKEAEAGLKKARAELKTGQFGSGGVGDVVMGAVVDDNDITCSETLHERTTHRPGKRSSRSIQRLFQVQDVQRRSQGNFLPFRLSLCRKL